MAPFQQDDYDLDLSTGGFDEFDEKDILDHLTVGTNPTVASTKKQRNKPSVSFYERVRIHFVDCLDDYTHDEHAATWCSCAEMDRIRNGARAEAGLLDAGVYPSSGTSRGLEGRTRLGEKRKRQHRLNAYAAVFFELDGQEQSGVMSERLVAEAYALYSKPCEKTALELGKQDAMAAMEIYNEALDTSQSSSSTTSRSKKHTKKPRNNSINLATHFRKTKKRSNHGCKPLLTLAPQSTSASSAA